MPRPIPILRPMPLLAQGHVYPDGSAYLEIAVQGTGRDLTLTRDQVAELEEKIAAFRRFVIFEEARPIERTHHYRESL